MLAVLANTRALRPSHRPARATPVRRAFVRPKLQRNALWFEPRRSARRRPEAGAHVCLEPELPYISGPSLVLLLALKEVFLGVHRKALGLPQASQQPALGLFLSIPSLSIASFLGILYLAI